MCKGGLGYWLKVTVDLLVFCFVLLVVIIGIGVDKYAVFGVIQYYFIKIAVGWFADGVWFILLLNGERVIVEIEIFYAGKRWYCIDVFFVFCVEQLQGGYYVYFWVIEFWDWWRVYYVVSVYFYWIGVGSGDMIEAGDIFIQFYLYYAVFFQCVYGAGFCFVRFDKVQRFRDWYLEDNDLIFG